MPLRWRLLLALTGAFSAQAQTFEPGYMIVDGDTLVGEIRLSIEAENARGAAFRTDAASPLLTFGPTQAEGYGAWRGRHYRRGVFQTQPVRDASASDRLGFARVVRDGTATLLALEVYNGGTLFYLSVAEDAPVGLYPADRVRDAREGRVMAAPFRETLRTALGACGRRTYSALPYTEAALAAVVDAHNTCHDPDYTPPETPALASRAPLTVSWEVGVGGARGTLTRARPLHPRPGYTDPSTQGALVRAAAVLAVPALHHNIRAFVDVEYAHNVVEVVQPTPRFDYDLQRISLVLGGIGARYEVPVPPVRAHLGGAIQWGTLLRRTVEADVDPDQQPGALRFFNPGGGVGGQYIEVGIQPTALPVALTARMQATAYGTERVFVPNSPSGSIYRVTSTSLSAVARF